MPASTKPGSGDPGDSNCPYARYVIKTAASTKPGSGDPGDVTVHDAHAETALLLQRSRGPETPGTGRHGARVTARGPVASTKPGSGDPGDRIKTLPMVALAFASTKPGSGDPGDGSRRMWKAHVEGAAPRGRASTKPGSGDPGDAPHQAAGAAHPRVASTKPGSGDPGDPCPAGHCAARCARFNEAGVRRPRGPLAGLVSAADLLPLQRSRGPETPGTGHVAGSVPALQLASTKPGSGDPGDLGSVTPASGDAGQPARCFNEAGVRRPRGPARREHRAWRWREGASTKPGSGDPGDQALALLHRDLDRKLQRSRGPETPGTGWGRERDSWDLSGFNEAGVRRPRGQLIAARTVQGTSLQRSRGPETPGTLRRLRDCRASR